MQFPLTKFAAFLTHRKQFIQIGDTQLYKRARVQLHWKGIVLRDEVEGALIKTKDQQVARQGELLVAEIDAKVGGVGIVSAELDGAIVSSHYFLFEIDETKCLRPWIEWFIRSDGLGDQFAARGSTNYAAIRPHHVLNCQIPLPPVPEQRRIVSRIEKLAARIREAHDLRRRAAAERVALLLSARSHVFSLLDHDNHPTLLDVCRDVTDGTHDTPKYVEQGTPFLTGLNIGPHGLDFERARHIQETDHRRFSQHCPVERGDVLLTLIGTIDKVAIVDTDREFSIKNIGLLKPDPTRLNSRYLFHFLQSKSFRDQAISYAKQTAQAFVGLKKLRTARIPVPSLSEQVRIVAYVDGLQAKLEVLQNLQSETAAELDALMPSILSRAFRGEL